MLNWGSQQLVQAKYQLLGKNKHVIVLSSTDDSVLAGSKPGLKNSRCFGAPVPGKNQPPT